MMTVMITIHFIRMHKKFVMRTMSMKIVTMQIMSQVMMEMKTILSLLVTLYYADDDGDGFGDPENACTVVILFTYM